jgi:hypothetical protein
MPDLMSWDRANHLLGESVVDKENRKIGKVEDLVNASDGLAPEWMVVKTSIFGRPRLVPIDGAEDRGGAIHVPYLKESVLSAPLQAVPTVIHRSEREALASHYARAA